MRAKTRMTEHCRKRNCKGDRRNLDLSLKTVETPLSHAYSKLGLAGPGARRGLSDMLADQPSAVG